MDEQVNHLINDKKINLNITTPRGLKFEEKADMIIMRCVDGDLGALPGHELVSVVLGDGIMRIYNDGIEKKLAVFGGIAEIGAKTVNVFSTIAQHPEEIDLKRAEADRQRFEATIREESEEKQIHSLHVLLRRSLVRIEASLEMDSSDEYEDND